MYQRITDKPKLVPQDYKTKYNEECIASEDNSGLKKIYYGTGISRDTHPLKKHINMRVCGNCNNPKVKVIYAQWSVHPMSGDKYYDYEVFCEKCQKFTSRSYTEN